MLTTECYQGKDLADLKEPWQALLSKSSADPLFMSWYWQSAWWQQWGDALGGRLKIVMVRHNKQLVAILPLYASPAKISFFDICRIQIIGNCWGKPTVRSEYLQPIVDRQFEASALDCIVSFIRNSIEWDEFVLSDSPQFEPLSVLFRDKLAQQGVLRARQYLDHGYRLPLSGSFASYVTRLGKNTRLKLLNRRKILEATTDFHLQGASNFTEMHSYRSFFKFLNQFHVKRWGKPAFAEHALAFHLALIESIANDVNYSADLSELSSSGRVLSTLYNINVGNTVYNLQSGYDECWSKKLALGTLHLGYSIEAAFEKKLTSFDFLLGFGKKTDYKQSFMGARMDTATIIYTPSIWIFALYKFRMLAGKLKKFWK